MEEKQGEQLELLTKKQVDLRLQFIHRPIRKRWYTRKYPFLVQNVPFEYGLKIRNIGTEAFSGATISEFKIHSDDSLMGGFEQKALSAPKIKALNPGEEFDLYVGRYTFWHEGSIGTHCKLIPDKREEVIRTYQHHRDHDFDEPYSDENAWWHDYYCQSQQQLLQTRTNNLILMLTVITVIEAVFGLRDSFKAILGLLAMSTNQITVLLQWLAS